MSMVFTVKDPTLLEGVAKGDKVKFVAMEEGGKLFITDIQSAE
jgi:Cu/Ag efflux protein CusF